MSVSVLRSLARTVAAALPEFEIRVSGEEGAWERPFAGVLASSPVSSTPHGAAYCELRQGFAVVAYCAEALNAPASMLEAQRVQRALWATLAAGIDGGPRRRPMRLPLWDYDGVPLFEAGPAERVGYLRISDPPTFGTFADPEGRWTVTADLRVGWTERIAAPPAGATVRVVGARRAA